MVGRCQMFRVLGQRNVHVYKICQNKTGWFVGPIGWQLIIKDKGKEQEFFFFTPVILFSLLKFKFWMRFCTFRR